MRRKDAVSLNGRLLPRGLSGAECDDRDDRDDLTRWHDEAEDVETQVTGSKRFRRHSRTTKVLITAGSLFVLVVHQALPSVHLDAVGLALLITAVIPWLGSVFESIDTPFGGVKYRVLEERVNELEGESASLRQVQEVREARDRARTSQSGASGPASARLEELVDEYNQVRDPKSGMVGGASRTSTMTEIVGEMIAATESGAILDVRLALQSGSMGRRLAAYVALYTQPDPAAIGPLIISITDLEPTSFGQFWGLRALSRLADEAGAYVLDVSSVRRLKELRSRLPAASDRMFELTQVLEKFAID